MEQQIEEVGLTEIYCVYNPEHIVELRPKRTQREMVYLIAVAC